MTSKLNYLIGMSLGRKVKTKWFIIANIILAIIIVGIINIDTIIKLFGGDFDKKQEVYVIDNTNKSFEIFKEQVNVAKQAFYGDTEEEIYDLKKYDQDLESAKKLIEEDNSRWIIVFDDDPENTIAATVVSEGYIATIDYQLISTAINNTKVAIAISETDLPVEKVAKLYSPIDINRQILDEDKLSEDESIATIMSTVFPVFILPFFMLIVFLVQMIGAEVNDEKSTRGMEIIISNVSPQTHFAAKVIAGNLFVLLQGGLLLIFGGIGLLIRKFIGGSGGGSLVDIFGSEISGYLTKILESGLSSQLIYIIPLTVILMLLTFVAYSLLAGILASMTTNTEDFQQLQTPLVIILLLGYYLATFAGFMEGSIFIKIVSFIPLISAILSPSLLVLGQIGIFDIAISIVIMVIFNWLLVKYGLKIYKVGILNYSSKDLWKKMFKALKE